MFEQDIEGDTQLHLAIASSYEEVFNALVRLAPKPEYLNIQNNELFAPLHIAVLTNQPRMVRRLVVAGATTQITDQEGNTPLHHACSRGFMECANMLLKPLCREEVRDQSVNSEQNQLHEVLDQRNHKGEHPHMSNQCVGPLLVETPAISMGWWMGGRHTHCDDGVGTLFVYTHLIGM